MLIVSKIKNYFFTVDLDQVGEEERRLRRKIPVMKYNKVNQEVKDVTSIFENLETSILETSKGELEN